jgi:thiamine pyrophosphate-dependent acetolactate synthase large subunit-like protein
MRGHRITTTEPRGPVYLCFDADLQEAPVTTPLSLPDVSKFSTPAPVGPDPEALCRVAEMLVAAESPVLLAGSAGRYPETLPAFEELAELLQAPVLLSGGNYILPSDHPLMVPGSLRTRVLGEADLLLALDVFDLAAALGPGTTPELNNAPYLNPAAKVIDVSVWGLTQHSLIADYEVLYPTDVSIAADSRVSVPMLRDFVRGAIGADSGARRRIEDRSRAVQRLQDEVRSQRESVERRGWDAKPISMERVSFELSEVVKDRGLPWTFVGAGRGAGFDLTGPEQVLPGGSGHRGGGLGEEIGSAIGAALALRGSGRLCINMLGDGNLLYTPSALWTAANLKLPLLTIVNNNFAYGNDEGHQEHMARMRGRPVENKGIGIYIDEPRTDFTYLAKAFDVEGIGPVIEPEDIRPALERAVEATMENRPVLVDVHSRRGRGGV